MSSIHAWRVFSAAACVRAVIAETDTSIPAFALRKACASPNESSRAADSAMTRLASGVARAFPGSQPSFPSAAFATPAFGA